jgi:probable HAF family extracellular repeat protein
VFYFHIPKVAFSFDAQKKPKIDNVRLMKIAQIILVIAVLSLSWHTSGQNYATVDLNTLGGNFSYAGAINSSGQLVGHSVINTSGLHPFLYSNGTMQDLGLVANSIGASANGINNSGLIVGTSTMKSGDPFVIITDAFLYKNGSISDIGLVNNIRLITANGINNAGQMVGVSTTNLDDYSFYRNYHAFVYGNGMVNDLGTLGGGNSGACQINNNGQIVGYSNPTGSTFNHAFLYSNGTMQDLGTLGGDSSIAYGINNGGQVVGVADNADGSSSAFLYSNGAMQNLGNLGGGSYSEAFGINNSSQIVGDTYDSNGDQHAFLYSGGVMKDLNSLVIPANSGWVFQQANAINDAGQIVGYGINPAGQTDAFLLNPYLLRIYTGFHQFDIDSSVPTEFGNDDSIQYASPGTGGNYGSDGRARTKSYGCALCSLASMLTSVSGFESMTPIGLDLELVTKKGYRNGCNMYWPAINTITQGMLKWVDSKRISASLANQSALDQYLDDHCWGNRYRVILQLEANGDKNETHYIFVVGKTSNDWNVFDPGWGNAFDLNTSNPNPGLLGLLSGHLTGFKSNDGVNRVFTVTGVQTYQLNPPSNGSLNQVVHSPVELLVTDPNGKRAGYDPMTGGDVFEISGASYSKDYPILDADTDSGGAGDTNGIKTVSVPGPLGGSYSTALIGTASGSYTFDSSIVWSENSQTNQTTTGTTDEGVITTNTSFVIVPPLITASAVFSGTFDLSFNAQTNVTYIIEGNSSLANGNWTAFQTLTATGINMTVSQPVTEPIMFYRVRSQ